MHPQAYIWYADSKISKWGFNLPRHTHASNSLKPAKSQRERSVLIGLVELYIEMGTPIGSNTLKDYKFHALSSATIRNYFASLEKEGFLVQHHASGGRIPTELAYKLYAHTHVKSKAIPKEDLSYLKSILEKDTKELRTFLQFGIEALSDLTGMACFMLAPRFDQDFIRNIKLVNLDTHRVLCILMTDFGFVHTEMVTTQNKWSTFALKRIEDYFLYRLTNSPPPKLSKEESLFAHQIYNEVILRHIIAYSNFDREDVYKSGFSKLLNHREFKDLSMLSGSLSLFENSAFVRSLLNDCFRSSQLKFWIGSDLSPYMRQSSGTSLIAMPYFVHHSAVGAIALMGPDRTDYPRVFALLKTFSKILSQTLTKTLYKHKITYRNPHPNYLEIKSDGNQMLIENQPF